MSSSSADQLSEDLRELEEYLDQGPRGDDTSLRIIATSLEHARPEKCVAVFQLLGTAVGKQHAWQTPLRDSGILQAVVCYLGSSGSPAVIKQCLRVVGNCVADNDVNREVVVKHLDTIIACLANDDLITTALAVLFNLFNDFEPAHTRAAELRLDDTLAAYMAAQRIPEQATDYATDVLHSTTEKLTAAQLIDTTSVRVFNNISKASLPYDQDRTPELLTILVHYMQDPAFQPQLATTETLDRLLDLLTSLAARLTPEETDAVFRDLATQPDAENSSAASAAADDTTVVVAVRLASSLAAVSGTDPFIQTITLTSPLVDKLSAILTSPNGYSPGTVTACVMLGNLATSDQTCLDMVQLPSHALHTPLLSILSTATQPALLYAAAACTRHLSFPPPNRTILASAGLLETCCHLLQRIADPAVRGEASAVLEKLLANTPSNVEKLVYGPLSSPHNTTENNSNDDDDAPKTMLTHLVSQALAPTTPLPSTTMKNASIELGRCIVAILRTLRSPSSSTSTTDTAGLSHAVFNVPGIARPVARLVRQRFYAAARSEGVLGLGLMAQDEEGARCVIGEMGVDAGLLGAVREVAVEGNEKVVEGAGQGKLVVGNGEEGNQNQNQNRVAGRDYQNAVVLLHGLGTYGGGAMDGGLRGEVEGLREELGRLMV